MYVIDLDFTPEAGFTGFFCMIHEAVLARANLISTLVFTRILVQITNKACVCDCVCVCVCVFVCVCVCIFASFCIVSMFPFCMVLSAISLYQFALSLLLVPLLFE